MGRPTLPSFLRAHINNSSTAPRRRRRSNSHPEQNPAVEVDPSWESSIREKLGRQRFQQRTNGRNRRTISRVPDHIGRVDPAAYEPTIVSIGPIHRNKEGLVITTEHKWCLVGELLSWVLGFFLRSSWHDELIAKCLKAMMELEAEARLCYPEEDVRGLSKEELAEMMLLDGCFIVWFLMRHMMESQPSESRYYLEYHFNGAGLHEGNLWIWALVKYDLLKLENQIPFFVVEAICDQVDVKFDVAKLLRNLFNDIQPPVARTPADVSNVEIHHLLHLFHISLLPPSMTSLVKVQSTKLAEWIPSATELRDAGIVFKNKDDSNSFLEVRFDEGILEVPRLYIYRYSDSIFRNLIAFEQCFPVAPYITSYVLFMSYMVHTAEDVRLLHLAGIVYNGQSTDEDVARFFKRLCDGVQYAFDANYLSDVFVAVRKYHEEPWHTWKAGLQHNYFSNPWVILSLIAAALLLVLTFLQTFFTIFPYYHPRN